MGSKAAEFVDASLTTLSLSNRCEITVRRLRMADVADCGPHAWAIFRAFTRYLEPEEDSSGEEREEIKAKVDRWQKAMESLGDEFGDVLISRAAVEPRVTLEGDGDEDTIPIWAIPEIDKQKIQEEIIILASGLDALRAQEVAARIARFRGGEAQPVPEETGDQAGGGDASGDGQEVGDQAVGAPGSR